MMRFSPHGSPNTLVFNDVVEFRKVSPSSKQFSTVTLILEFGKLGKMNTLTASKLRTAHSLLAAVTAR